MSTERNEDFEPVDNEISMSNNFEEKLNIAARTVVETCMEIRRHESVLVIADPSTSEIGQELYNCLLYTSPSPRDGLLSRMPSSA